MAKARRKFTRTAPVWNFLLYDELDRGSAFAGQKKKILLDLVFNPSRLLGLLKLVLRGEGDRSFGEDARRAQRATNDVYDFAELLAAAPDEVLAFLLDSRRRWRREFTDERTGKCSAVKRMLYFQQEHSLDFKEAELADLAVAEARECGCPACAAFEPKNAKEWERLRATCKKARTRALRDNLPPGLSPVRNRRDALLELLRRYDAQEKKTRSRNRPKTA